MLIAAKFFGGADRQGVRVFDLVRNPAGGLDEQHTVQVGKAQS